MDQQIQEAYLASMGVTQWYPRFNLPHAPELDWPDVPTENTPSIAAVDQSNALPTLDSGSSDSLSKLKSLMSVDEADSKSKVVPRDESAQPMAESTPLVDSTLASNIVPPLNFLFFRYPLGVSVVVSVPSDEYLSSMETRFINAVLSFLGVPDTVEFNHRVSWPLIKNNPQFSTQAFFSESMSALFDKQAVAFGVDTYLVFGQRLSTEISAVLKALPMNDLTLKVVEAPELPELLTSVSEKRRLWTRLLPLTIRD